MKLLAFLLTAFLVGCALAKRAERRAVASLLNGARSVLVLSLLLSGCASAWSYSGPGSRNGLLHGAVAATATLTSDAITGNPWYGAVAMCAAFIAHEFEESRGFSDWHVAGKTDGILDMAVPCSVGFAVSLKLGGDS